MSAVGLYTFFLPMVVLDQPLLSRTEWSPCEIATNIYLKNLPVSSGRLDVDVIGIGLIYLLILLSLVAIWFQARPAMLFVITGLGFALSSLGKFWEHGFLYTFGWEYFGRLHRGITWWLLPFVMPALVAICLARSLDGSESV